MDAYGDGFREIARGASGGSPVGPVLKLVGALLASIFLGFLGFLGVFINPGFWSTVLGIVFALVGLGLAVQGPQQFRLRLRARQAAVDGRGLSMVEGPAECESRKDVPYLLAVGGQRFDLADLGGPVRQTRLARALAAPTVVRAWFLPGSGLADPVLVRLDARPRTGAELLGDVADLERGFAVAAAADEVRPDRYQRFLAELPALRAGFTPGAPGAARKAALKRMARQRRHLGSSGRAGTAAAGSGWAPPSTPPARPEDRGQHRPTMSPVRAVPPEVLRSYRGWKTVGILSLVLPGVLLFLFVTQATRPGLDDNQLISGPVTPLIVIAGVSVAILAFNRQMLAGSQRGRIGVAVVGGLWGLALLAVGLQSWSMKVVAVPALALVVAAVVAFGSMFLPNANRYFDPDRQLTVDADPRLPPE